MSVALQTIDQVVAFEKAEQRAKMYFWCETT
jgi:hypothetical protein